MPLGPSSFGNTDGPPRAAIGGKSLSAIAILSPCDSEARKASARWAGESDRLRHGASAACAGTPAATSRTPADRTTASARRDGDDTASSSRKARPGAKT
jgi:hypothetical protein